MSDLCRPGSMMVPLSEIGTKAKIRLRRER